jgi:hypothetical protein
LLCWDQTQGLVNARQELKYILSPWSTEYIPTKGILHLKKVKMVNLKQFLQ